MKSSRRAELQVGLAVLISLIVLIGGIMWGKGQRLGMSRYPIRVSFNNVSGMEAGANVLANGVVAGRVTKIELAEGKVFVTASIEKSVQLHSDCKITLESPTLMAGRVLSIYPGTKPPLLSETMSLTGSEPFGVSEAMTIMQDMTDDFKATLKHVNELLVNLNAVTGDTAFQRNIADLARNSDDLTRTAAELLRNNRVQLETTLDQLSATIASAERLTSTASQRIDSTFDSVDDLVAEISTLASSLRTVTDRLSDGSSTAGKLFTDDELYHRLNTTLADVDSLVVSIRKNGLRNKIVLF